jgi:hypothetical protein
LRRQQFINFDPDAAPSLTGLVVAGGAVGTTSAYSASFLSAQQSTNIWKSYIFQKNSTADTGIIEIAVTATIYLKHLHSFFAMCPLLKGVFMKLTLNLNNCSTTVAISGTAATPSLPNSMALQSTSVPVGGVCPILIASTDRTVGKLQGGANMFAVDATGAAATYVATLSVGGKCLNQAVVGTAGYLNSPLAQSIYLYVPAYTFNPIYEQAYLSSPIKQINYTDVYQYQVQGIQANSPFNNLLTNGIADVKSVLLLGFFSAGAGTANTNLPTGMPVYQSPFDPAGTGMCSPLTFLTNFNVVVSGQNAIECC